MALFRFYLLLFFSGVKAVYFHFSFQFLCKEMVLVRKSCPDQKLVYTFSDPKFPVKPQLSKGPTTFNSKDSSVPVIACTYCTSYFRYEGNCVMSEHSSTTAKQAGHPNIFGMDDNPAHFPHRPRSGMPHD